MNNKIKLVLTTAILISVFCFARTWAQDVTITKPVISKIESKVEKADDGLNIRVDWTMEKPGVYSYLFSKGQENQEILARYTPPTTGNSTGGFYIDPNVKKGETYTYSVVASDENGNVSDKSSTTVVARVPDCKVDKTETSENINEGTSSLSFSPSRYSLNGGDKNNLVPVGAAEYSLYIAQNQNQQKTAGTKNEFVEITSKTSLDGIGATLREILCKMLAKISPKRLAKASAGIIDNGASSTVILDNLPAGDYLLFINKEGFKGVLVEFSLESGQKAKLPLTATALRPEVGAEPPAFGNAKFEQVEKSKGETVHTVEGLGGTYIYKDSLPWWGWQKESEIKTNEPNYKSDQPGVVQ